MTESVEGASLPLVLGGHQFTSRLILGTGKFSDRQTLLAAVEASGAEMVTVALRRFHRDAADDMVEPLLARKGLTLLPNTSGARTADEAVRAALLARELCGSPFVKVEIHPNPRHLLPDAIETYEACRLLVREGFVVLPYMPADPVLAKRLEEIGCAAVMPLGAAIGSGRGLQTREMIEWILRESRIPVIVDAGLRSPGEAALAMEMGCEAVLVNSAVAAAENPAAMAAAFALAVRAGHLAHRAGLMAESDRAQATSPLTGFLYGSPAGGEAS